MSYINSEVINILSQVRNENTCNLEKEFSKIHVWLKKHNLCHKTCALDDYKTYDFLNMCAVTYLATVICSYKVNLIFRLKQLHMFNWCSQSMIKKTYQRLQLFMKQNVYVPLHKQCVDFSNTDFGRRFRGFIDCYDIITDTVYKFKCTNNIENTHIIQTLVYHYMADIVIPYTTDISKTSYIYNMKTTECVEITASHKRIKSKKIIKNILQSKIEYFVKDEEFIRACLEQ